MTLKDVPAVSVWLFCVVKVKSFNAPGPAVIVLEVPDLISAVAVIVAFSVFTSLKPLILPVTPVVKVWLPLAGFCAAFPAGELLPPLAHVQATDLAPS